MIERKKRLAGSKQEWGIYTCKAHSKSMSYRRAATCQGGTSSDHSLEITIVSSRAGCPSIARVAHSLGKMIFLQEAMEFARGGT